MNIFEERGTRHRQNDVFLAEFMHSFSLRSRNLINLITSLLILLPPLLRMLVAESSVNVAVNNKIKKEQLFVIFSFSHLSNGCSRKEAIENDLLNLLNYVLWNFIELTWIAFLLLLSFLV